MTDPQSFHAVGTIVGMSKGFDDKAGNITIRYSDSLAAHAVIALAAHAVIALPMDMVNALKLGDVCTIRFASGFPQEQEPS